MGVNFSKDPGAQGFFAPMRFEAAIHDCEVEGEIPTDIHGVFYRTGLDRQYPKRFLDDAPFNDDGFVDMFAFSNGHVDFRSRYVHTPRFVAERKARKALFGRYRNQYTSLPEVRDVSMNVANTNIVYHARKLLVLKESNLPIAMNPATLRTEGDWTFNGRLTSPTFTAHPKIDEATGEMICFGYEAKGDATTDVALYSVDKDGNIIWETWIKAPNVSMLHDIAITDKHIIIPTNCFTTSVERLKEGKVHWGYDRGKTCYVGIMERGGDGKDLRWFKGPEAAVIHTINAFTDGDKVILDSPVSDSNPFPFFPAVDGAPFDPSKAMCNIRRWTFDLSKTDDTYEEDVLFAQPMGGGLARMDDRYIGRPHRYSYMGVLDPSKPFDTAKAGNLQGRVTNCYARFDHARGTVDSFFAGDTHSLQECCFVPRRADAPEGDGYLVGVASNYAEMKSELVIVDAQNLEDGTVARVKMPFRLHAQVHGNWVPAEILPVDDGF